VIPPAIFFYYSTLSDSRFKTLQQNPTNYPLDTVKRDGVSSNFVAVYRIVIMNERIRKDKHYEKNY
ncbi:hypothetical protein, partial [Tetragenococcus halophilus]